MKFLFIDPATGERIGTAPDCTKAETTKAIEAASKALESWSQTTAKERHDLLMKLHSIVMENQEDLGIIITRENGKIFEEAKGEVEYGSSFFEWFAEEAVRSNGITLPITTSTQRTITITQPVGVVSIVCPWSKFHSLNFLRLTHAEK